MTEQRSLEFEAQADSGGMSAVESMPRLDVVRSVYTTNAEIL